MFSVELLRRQLDPFAPSGAVTQVRWDTIRPIINMTLTCCGVLGLVRPVRISEHGPDVSG